MVKQEAQKALGELFIIGFNGLELSTETIGFLKEARIGGTLLFSHNYESPAQVAELTHGIQECRSELPLWVCADHEGGRVQRFKRGFTRIPDAASIAGMDSAKLAFDIAAIISKELKSVGVNVNFCPVADIATNPKNPVIGNRAYGNTEEKVTRMCTAIVRGHLVNGVQPCVKHFPGHGDTHSDSHFTLPAVQTPLEMLQEREFKPFQKAFKSGCSMVMTAHILAQNLDPKFPATLSSTVLSEILREKLRFQGLIISDDLEMKAITDHFGAEEAPRLAIQAGCDLLIYRTEAAARLGYEALVHALEKGNLAPETVIKAAERSRHLKKQCLTPYHPISIADVGKNLCLPEDAQLIQQVEVRKT